MSDNVQSNEPSNIEQLINRWLIGSNAPPKSEDFPDSWQVLLEALPVEKQSVMALGLMGHYQALTEQPTVEQTLKALDILPKLDAPMIHNHVPSMYYLVKKLLDSADSRFSVLSLLAERGYALPPVDYFSYIASKQSSHDSLFEKNSSNTEKSHVDYQPWQLFWDTWQTQLHTEKQTESLEIDAESWADFMPAFRRQALQLLRHTDAQACRDLIVSCFMQEPAEERVKILNVLYIQLSSDDIPFLQSLHNDRSKKVVETAKNLLIRVGCFQQSAISQSTDNEHDEEKSLDLALLAQGFEVKKTKKQASTQEERYCIQVIVFREHKKRNKRRDLLTQYGVFALAESLSVSIEQLIAGWAFNKHHEDDNRAFLACISHLPDQYMPIVVESLASYIIDNATSVLGIWHRFTHVQRQHLLHAFIHQPKSTIKFYDLLEFETHFDEAMDFKVLQSSQVWKNMFVKKANYWLEENLMALGFLLKQSLANEALAYLQNKYKEEYTDSDPLYYSLRLNAGLDSYSFIK